VTVHGAPSDPDFGIITYNSVALRREIEVFQWTERCKPIEKRLSNGQVKTGKSYSYTAEWSTSFKDSSRYADPKYRVNIAPSLQNKTMYAQGVNIDHRTFSAKEVSDVFGSERMANMFARGPLTAQPDPNGVWGYDRQQNAIVRMREPGKTTIGDIRVRYFITSNSMETSGTNIQLCGVDNKDGKLQLTQTLSKHS